MERRAGYDDFVFINCPFDAQYSTIFQAIVFAIYRCGFWPRSALEEDNGLDNRLDKITRIISECRLGIHDISRIELNANNLPRFNMPFELGIFFGAKRFGNELQQSKNALIFERQQYSYQQYISDISGVDIKAHNNDVYVVICKVRDWLRNISKRSNLPSASKIFAQHKDFQKRFSMLCRKLKLNSNDIMFNDFCSMVEDLMADRYLKDG